MNKDHSEIIIGSGNIFRDLGFPDADVRQAKAIIAAAILKSLDKKKWSIRKAAAETGVAHSEFARIRNITGLKRFTLDRLITIHHKLNPKTEISISVHPRRRNEYSAGTHV